MCCEIYLGTISHTFYLSSHLSTFYQLVTCLHFPNSFENHIPTGNITESGVKWIRTKVSDLISVNPIVASINLNEVGVVKEINYDVHPCLLHGFIGIILLEGPKALSFWPRNKSARSLASACPFTSLPVVVLTVTKAHPAASNKSIKCVTWVLRLNVLSSMWWKISKKTWHFTYSNIFHINLKSFLKSSIILIDKCKIKLYFFNIYNFSLRKIN